MEHQQENQDSTTAPTYKIWFITGSSRGFEHPQSFNKLFKAKTKVSPLAFRKMFN